MAVEAKHINLYPSQQQQIFSNQVNGFSYNTQMASALPLPTIENSSFLPFHHSLMCDSVQPKTSVNTDSGLTFNLPPTATANANAVNAAATRKRSRDSFNQFNTCNNITTSFVGDDVLPLLQQYQLDIDRIVSHHTKKIRLELEERQKQQARVLVAAIGEGVTKKLKEKDEQIQRMGKIYFVLQEKVKSLYVENQLWRDLAQTNEATANSLRNNLEQVLAHVGDERLSAGGNVIGAAVEEDAESCCGSSDHGAAAEEEEEIEGRRTLACEAQDNRMCKRCGERESSVLLLPCRHLCLCSVCGSTLLHTCPVCNSNMNATVHVNMSS